MPDPSTRRLNLPPEEFTELALRLHAQQPQLRALAQRLLAAHLMRQSLEDALGETTDKVLAQGNDVKPKLKEQFLLLRKAKEDAESLIDFYKAAGDALAVLSLSPLPQAKYADAAGRRMLELGDAWEKAREDAAVRDVIRILLRELTYAIHGLPMTQPEGGLSPDQLREQRMQEALERTKITKMALAKISAAAKAAHAPAAGVESPQGAPVASAAGQLVPFPSSSISTRLPSPGRRPVLVSSPPPSIFPAPRASGPMPGAPSILSKKPDRSELVRQMAVQSARTRRSGVSLIKPIPEGAKSPKPPRRAKPKPKSKKKSRRGA